MKTAIIGVGNVGPALAGYLVDGDERVVLAASDKPDICAKQLGDLASTPLLYLRPSRPATLSSSPYGSM